MLTSKLQKSVNKLCKPEHIARLEFAEKQDKEEKLSLIKTALQENLKFFKNNPKHKKQHPQGDCPRCLAIKKILKELK